jgi:hypothetical protein
MDMVAWVRRQIARPLVLHFTALEKGKVTACPVVPSGDDTSLAEALVFWIAEAAADRAIVLRGENALACLSPPGWDRVANAFRFAGYSGFTLLRLEDFEFRRRTGTPVHGCEGWNQEARDRYKAFISQCIAASCAVRQP